MNLEQFYTAHAERYDRQLSALRARGRGFVVVEIVAFVAFFALLVGATQTSHNGWRMTEVVLSLVSLVVYLAVRRLDVRNDERIRDEEDLRTAYEREAQAQRGDHGAFDDGARYVDAHHAFSFDLDLFGSDGLYQRMCRTVSTGGSDALAQRLRDLQPIGATPEEIDRLAADVSFRMAFVAKGSRGKIDTEAIRQSLMAVRQLPIPTFLTSPWLALLVRIDVVAFLVSVVAAVMGWVDAMLPVWWGTFHFFLAYALCNARLRHIGGSLEHLQGQMRQLVAVVSLLTPSRIPSFSQLNGLLNDLDKRGNILGLLLTDSFYLSDMLVVRRFAKWREQGADEVEAWMDRMVRKDVEVTVATLRYNHPATVWPEQVSASTLTFEACGLWHPFLGAKAVRNDFRIDDRNFYIVTGANMAGKSTFLRAIGVNYVLAMTGMPVFAERLSVSRFKLFSSMRTSDDLSRGISYFNAELLRLKQLIAFCGHNVVGHDGRPLPTLIILDEILKGTNSADKLNGSRMFLEAISHKDVAGIIATHDLKLSEMAYREPSRFHNYCFEIDLGERVTYSYKITPGVAKNQNATYLLRQILESGQA